MLTASPSKHIPVMVQEVVSGLMPHDGGIYVDGTFGQGGYSQAILMAANCQVWGIDRDPEAVKIGHEFEQKWPARFNMIKGRFGDMTQLLAERALEKVDGIALDLGVSSPQLDELDRGFSFRLDGPLDMRMEKTGLTAADLVNELSEQELADIIYEFGEERYSRRIARKIVAVRKAADITRTFELADLVRSVVPREKRDLDPATRTFQALRIKVNEELKELDNGLKASEILLKPRGRLAIVSFHSLEDRRIKNFLKDHSRFVSQPNRHAPITSQPIIPPTFLHVSRKAIRPMEEEVRANPRARSAKLRVAERTDVPFNHQGTIQ
ncbi:MAG: 16S rRNA (cytosine(1402)-N(4))-methyltransferase RsmH [Alphaproteobacteria bacterium]|nr:16S rRNA (cytosine(1402)-N(4))-methyltransferase RsmH [Alphaproteobacteria bacterium]